MASSIEPLLTDLLALVKANKREAELDPLDPNSFVDFMKVVAQRDQAEALAKDSTDKAVKLQSRVFGLEEMNRQLNARLNSCLDDLLPAQASARKWQERALEEREACAKVAEGGRFLHDDSPAAKFGRCIADAIRTREAGEVK